MVRKKTHDEFVAEVEALVGDEYEVIGEYEYSHTKIKMKHSICNHIYEVSPNDFLRGSRCPSCFGTTKKDTETYRKEVFELVGDEYGVIGEYKNSKTKIKMKHSICNNIYEVLPSNFLVGGRCPSCSRSMKKDIETLKKEVFEILGDEYEVIGEYKNANTKIKMKHTKCNHIYEVLPSNLLKGKRCPSCFGIKKKDIETYRKEVFELVGDEYGVIGEYKGALTKIKMKHNICNHIYEVKPNNFLIGQRCPKCRESKGEVAVSATLEKLQINHVAQAKFDACKYRRALPFDFAVYNASNELLGLIEYDGEQHFRAVDYFGGEKTLKGTQRRDAIKTQYCADNGIPLLRIPYTEFDNIDEIVTKWLRNLHENYVRKAS